MNQDLIVSQGRRYPAGRTSEERGGLDSYCSIGIVFLHHRNIHNPPIAHRSPIIDSFDSCYHLPGSTCLFALRLACLSRERFLSPHHPPSERSRHGSTYDHPQEQTEGEGDARSLPVNRHIQITHTAAADFSRLRSGLDNAGKTTILKRLNGEDFMAVSPTLGFNIKTFVHEG